MCMSGDHEHWEIEVLETNRTNITTISGKLEFIILVRNCVQVCEHCVTFLLVHTIISLFGKLEFITLVRDRVEVHEH